jgi:hypothetical protein
MAKQPKHDEAVEEIKALEDRRYRAMLAGNTVVLDELCADDLIYTHSKANFDDKLSYLHKSPRREHVRKEHQHRRRKRSPAPTRTSAAQKAGRRG